MMRNALCFAAPRVRATWPLLAMMVLLSLGLANLGWATTIVASGQVAYQMGANGSWNDHHLGNGDWQANPTVPTEYYFYVDQATLAGRSITVGDIESISYWTKNPNGTPFAANTDFYLQIYTMPHTGDCATSTWYGYRLTAEPYLSRNYTPPAVQTWNNWATDAASNQLAWFDNTPGCFPNSYGYGGPTLSELQAHNVNWNNYWSSYPVSDVDYAGQTIKYIKIGSSAAGNWAEPNFNGLVDEIHLKLKPAAGGDDLIFDLEGNPIHNITQNTYYPTIELAVNAANSGDVIQMDAGTYPTGLLTINKDITLQGADSGHRPVITCSHATGDPWSGDAGAWILVGDGYSITARDLIFDGTGYNIARGLRTKGPGLIDHCEFRHIKYDVYYGLGINSVGSYPFTVQNCNFFDIGRVGTHLNDPTLSPKIYRHNTYTGKGAVDGLDYALEVERGGNVLAENNTITSCRAVASADGSTSAGMYATTYFNPGGTTTLVAHGNIMTDNSVAFAMGYEYDGVPADMAVGTFTGNKMEGNDYGVSSVSVPRVEATANWWGAAIGPAGSIVLSNRTHGVPFGPNGEQVMSRSRSLDEQVEGSVHYSPWVASNGNDHDGATDGWQPDLSVVGVSTNGTIQEGINLVSGSTVNVAAGTYEEQLEISHNGLHLVGAGVGSTIIQSPATLPLYFNTSTANHPVVYVHDATGVSLSGLTVDGLGRGNANYRFEGIAFFNAGGELSNVRVTAIRETPFNGAQHGVAVYSYNTTGGPFTINVTDVAVDDYQKNGFALSGVGLTVNLLRVTATGHGSTALNAQNGIQVGYGASGTMDYCTAANHDYIDPTGTWTAAGFLLYNGGNVAITHSTLTNNEDNLSIEDTDGSLMFSTITGNDSSSHGVYIDNEGAARSQGTPRRHARPMEEAATRNNMRLDEDHSFTVSNCTLTGANVAYTGGVTAGSFGSDLNLTVQHNVIRNWGIGVVPYTCCGGTIHTALISDNQLSNIINGIESTGEPNTPGRWTANCYADYGSNAGFSAGHYNIYDWDGTTVRQTDLTPNVNNCANVDFLTSSAYVGCTGTCVNDTLYLTFDKTGYINGHVVLQLPAGIEPAWTASALDTFNAYPLTNAAPHLYIARAQHDDATNQITVDLAWGPPYSDGNASHYIAYFPLRNVSGVNPLVISGVSSIFGDRNGEHENAVSLGTATIAIDCAGPVTSITANAPAACAYKNAASLEGAFTVGALRGDLSTNAPMTAVYVQVGTNPANRVEVTLMPGDADYTNATFPNTAQASALWGFMPTDGCYDLYVYAYDTECNEGVSATPLHVIRDTVAPVIGTDPMSQPLCYNNEPTSPQYGRNLIAHDLNINVNVGTGTCIAPTGVFQLRHGADLFPATPVAMPAVNWPEAADTAGLWDWIVTELNLGGYSFDVIANDCAGNMSTQVSFTICGDFVAPLPAFTTFDARPTYCGVWLKWDWNYSSSLNDTVEIWRKAEGDYPNFASHNWSNLNSYEKVHSNLVANGWTRVLKQAGTDGTTSADYDSNPAHHYVDPTLGNYYLDVIGTDAAQARDIYRYVTFARDAAGNWSQVSAYEIGRNADRSTNYWLGDFTGDQGNPAPHGDVDPSDLAILSAHYFQAVSPGWAYLNIGPENRENGFGKGIPLTNESFIDFNDLVPFSFNFGVVSHGGFLQNPPTMRPFGGLDHTPVVNVVRSGDESITAGSNFTVTVSLSGNDHATKATEVELSFDPEVLELVSATPANFEVSSGIPWSVAKAVTGEAGKVIVAAAAMGENSIMNGDAALATVEFRWKSTRVGSTRIEIPSVKLSDGNGGVTSGTGMTMTIGAEGILPTAYALFQNYPNPFNPTTTINFDLKENGFVKLSVYNLLGQQVATIVNNTMEAGHHTVNFDANGLSSGLYIYKIEVNGFTALHKMMLMR